MQNNDNHNSNPEYLTETEIRSLAIEVNGIRGNWHVPSLVTLLTELARDFPARDLRRAAITAAKNSHNRTPASIRWAAENTAATATAPEAGVPCAVCSKPPHRCHYDRPRTRRPEDRDTHVYTTPAVHRAQVAASRVKRTVA